MGKCKVELAITLNTGDFNNVKATVGFEEEYHWVDNPGKLQEARDEKFQELLDVCNDKLDEAVLTAVKKIKAIKNGK
jgi:hypothetical protein